MDKLGFVSFLLEHDVLILIVVAIVQGDFLALYLRMLNFRTRPVTFRIRRYASGYRRSVLRAIRCTSCRASCSRSLSSYCIPQYGTRSRTPGPRGSYCSIPSRRWCPLETVEARLYGEGLWAFSRGSLLYLRQVWVVQIPSCMENIELWSVEAA